MSDDKTSSAEAASVQPTGSRNDPPQAISSEDLLQGRNELWINHEGQLYRLRVTSRGKLYLTK